MSVLSTMPSWHAATQIIGSVVNDSKNINCTHGRNVQPSFNSILHYTSLLSTQQTIIYIPTPSYYAVNNTSKSPALQLIEVTLLILNGRPILTTLSSLISLSSLVLMSLYLFSSSSSSSSSVSSYVSSSMSSKYVIFIMSSRPLRKI